ncbi:MAG: HD domain-containing protein [Chloroflexota bacterium]|nr:HD domain-containing protein [Chloroflexota bacterium]
MLRLTLHRSISLVTAAAAASLVVPPTWYQPPEVWLPAFVLLTILSAALEFVAVPLPRGGVLSVATITHVATILLVPAPFAALSIGAAVLLEEAVRRVDRTKALFNVASFMLTASVASLALGLLGDFWAMARVTNATGVVQLKPFLLIAVAGGVYNLVNSLLTAWVIAKATDLPFVYLVRVNTRNTGLSEMGGTTVGGLFALIWTVEPLWTALLALPAAVISRSLQHIRQLETETRSAVRSMAQIIDHRDSTTFHHSERVASYAVALARELKLPEDEVELIEQAAAVHDLGKVGVPDAVLLKPGPLTESERALMWVHTEIGARILGNFQLFRSGAEIVLHHHESWDGTGYPARLAGEAIPLGARVVAVADSFDAMTSGRPYRAALPVDDALDRLRRGSGVQWDPTVVGAFIKLVLGGKLELADARTLGRPREGGMEPEPLLERPPDEVLDERLRQELRDLDHPAALVVSGRER